MKILDHIAIREKWLAYNAERSSYRLMYSTLWGGYVNDPSLMMVPIDEHMVHRGDGVFEAIRMNTVKCYLLEPHVDRLMSSARMIGLELPMSKIQLMDICEEMRIETVGRSAQEVQTKTAVTDDRTSALSADEGALRIFVGRGPGDFSPNPYSTIGAQVYVVAMDYKSFPEEKFRSGVSVMISKIPIKPDPFSRIKSLNYLPNVMMKKESLDHGYDFAVGLNEDGFIAEGPTENIMIVGRNGHLIAPRFDYTLRGTTLVRVMDLAQSLGLKSEIRDVSLDELVAAKEVMMVGTTLEVLPVTKIEKDLIAGGQVGDISRKLRDLLLKDMRS